ncbi:penicillin-binding transpeptidase domain-containing protein [Streptomyces inhibens]|uniref:penicillin-binding transpeptidase domain-containing protein n=1 Tax=Streptomyces inhibens TaxID=2293571 RepID=UPI001EE731F0|nr:penicillin-binding transpeptidase domain-containing protein [Streptomyces inhibens]UKY48916.1 penicillin-binding protein [Streptomyces inhibens]
MPKSGYATTRRRKPRTMVRAVTSVAVVSAVAVGGTYAAGLGPFARGAAGPDPAALAQARAFLADWAAGRLPNAAGRTTRPATAQDVLRNFTAGLDIGKPTLTAAAPTEAEDDTVSVPFTAKMPITDLGTWTYTSKLPLRKQGDGSWKVDWTLSLVHPRLSGAKKFHLEREDTDAPEVTDRKGVALSGDTFPSLSPVLAQIDDGAGGTGPRGAIQLVDRATGKVERTEATFGKKSGRPSDRPVRTTLDATWQAAAEKALASAAHGKNASLVALRIDNGEILAMANSPSSGFNRAVSGTYAPGSTWKIVTSGALLLKGAVAPADIVDCPKYLTVGKEFHNVETSEHRNATFLKDFTESCNTAFIGLRGKLGDQEPGDVAGKYFGVGQEWHVGIPSYDGSVPAPQDETEKAASMIGQGRIQANPLIMASVTATAVSGTFHQPSITRGNRNTTTTTPLPQKVVTQLRAMMRATVTDGTARVLSDLPGDVGAKTGTAEVSEEEPNNGWLAAHRGNVAVACVVEQGVTGGGSAGPVVRDLLAAVPADPS